MAVKAAWWEVCSVWEDRSHHRGRKWGGTGEGRELGRRQRPSSVPPQQEWMMRPAAGNVARQGGGDGGGCEWCRARWAAVGRWGSATAWCGAYKCGMQSAPFRGQRWGTGRSKAGGNRPRR